MPEQLPPQPSRPMQTSARTRQISNRIGYFCFFYLFLLIVTLIGYPFSKHFIEPLVALVFPISPGNSLMKALVVMSVFYWGGIAFRLWVEPRLNRRKK